MTLTGDHLAWQQRVFKETNASSKFLDLERQTIRSTGAYSKSSIRPSTRVAVKVVLFECFE